MMDPCPKREENFNLSPLWCSNPGKHNPSHFPLNVSSRHMFPDNTIELTGVGEPPAVCIFPQQTAERVPVLVQIDIRCSNANHLSRNNNFSTNQLLFSILFLFSLVVIDKSWRLTMSVPYTGDVILISQKCCPSASSLEPRTAAVPQL